MRSVKEFTTAEGEKRFRVRYRSGGTETSETFREKADATEFAAVLSGGGVVAARAWIAAREANRLAPTFNQWLELYVNQLTAVTPRTRADHFNQARRYLTPIADMQLPLITRAHVASIVNDLEARGLAPKTIKNVIHMASSVFALAVEDGHMASNPCRRVRLPSDSVDRVEARFLEHEEFSRLLAAIPAHYQPFVAFLVGTGLRWSEATAIEGRHVSLERGTVRVERAWKREPGRGHVMGVPKSKKSRRTVNAAVGALAAAASVMRGPGDLVFTTPSGLPIRHNNFYNRVWKPACKAAGYPDDDRPRIHDLRHTHASWLISDGVPLEAVQDQLGHESILTTRKVYGHLLPAVGVAVGLSASAALARALPQGMQFGPWSSLPIDSHDVASVEGSDQGADADHVGAADQGGSSD